MRHIIGIVIALLVLAGCMTGTSIGEGDVTTRNLGHSTGTMGGESIAAAGLDQPYMLWTDAEQHTVISPNPSTAMTVSLPNGVALHLSSPKDGSIGAVGVQFEAGEIVGVSIEGITYSVSDPIAARAAVVSLLVDYAKAMSADRRAEFVAFMETLDPALAEAIRLAVP